MTTRLITPPVALAVSIADAKANLRETTTDLDAIITAWLEGIIAHAEHVTGRSFITQTWKRSLDGFPAAIELHNAPIVSVTSVKYYDVDNALQTLDPADYLLDSNSEPGIVLPSADASWPATYDRPDAVQVEYVAGYGATEADVPKGIKAYLIARLTEQFDPSIRPEKDTIQSSYIDRLLDRFRIYSL